MKALFASFAMLFISALFACNYPRTKEIVKIKNDTTKTYAKEPNDSADYTDAKTFKVVSGQKWDAEDKNYKYETGNRYQ